MVPLDSLPPLDYSSKMTNCDLCPFETSCPECPYKKMVDEDICPKCMGDLDIGFECNQCKYDAIGFVERNVTPYVESFQAH